MVQLVLAPELLHTIVTDLFDDYLDQYIAGPNIPAMLTLTV